MAYYIPYGHRTYHFLHTMLCIGPYFNCIYDTRRGRTKCPRGPHAACWPPFVHPCITLSRYDICINYKLAFIYLFIVTNIILHQSLHAHNNSHTALRELTYFLQVLDIYYTISITNLIFC